MIDFQPHAFIAWLIIIASVCIAVLIGKMIDYVYFHRHAAQNPSVQPVIAVNEKKNKTIFPHV
ncbi:MAG: hypothetical protein K2M01_06755 [Paramuribaculum sp.]|nr:hypothetical protein [Paramuribaculum sp.]